MAVKNLERDWQSLTCSPGKSEALFVHDRGADRGYSALMLKVRAHGRSAWIWEYRDAVGKLRRRTYGAPPAMDYNAADRLRQIDIVTLTEGHDPVERARQETEAAKKAAAESLTMNELLDLYVTQRLAHGGPRRKAPKPRYLERAKQRLQPVRAAWGSRQAKSIGVADIRDFLNQYLDRPAMLELMEAHLFSVFGWAKKQGRLEAHPWPDYERQGHHGKRERFLDDEEVALAIQAARAIGYPGGSIILLSLLTARRYSEVAEAEWSEFDLARELWVLPGHRAKNGKTHSLPLSPTAVEFLRDAAERKAGAGRYVFHRPGVDEPVINIRADVISCRRAAQSATDKRLEPEQRVDWTPHDLRRTASTHLEILECPDAVVKAVLNHHDKRGVTALYMRMMHDTRLRLELLRKWLTALDVHYAELKPALALPAPIVALPAPAPA